MVTVSLPGAGWCHNLGMTGFDSISSDVPTSRYVALPLHTTQTRSDNVNNVAENEMVIEREAKVVQMFPQRELAVAA